MPQAPVDVMRGNTRFRDLGSRAFSEFGDPDQIRNPYYLDLENANADLRTRRARADAAEFAASPDRQRVDRMQRQYDSDIDLEKRGPARIDAMAGLDRRKRNIEAESYFDAPVAAQRESERNFQRDRLDRQYGDSARARMYDAELDYRGKVEGEDIRARGGVNRARVGALPRVREQHLNPDDNTVIPGNESGVGAIDQMLGIGGSKPFPRSKVGRLAESKFGGDLAAAEEALAAEGYYVDDEQ